MNEKGAIENEVAIVSGGLGYIGREIGCHLAQRGYKTVLLYLSPQEDMKAIRSSFKSANVYFYQCDITDSAKMKEVLDAIEEELGSISVGIHAAHSRLVRKNILDVDFWWFQFSATNRTQNATTEKGCVDWGDDRCDRM